MRMSMALQWHLYRRSLELVATDAVGRLKTVDFFLATTESDRNLRFFMTQYKK
jgi:hypothetical protein